MEYNAKIELIENEVIKGEIVIEEVIEIVKPELKEPAVYCFGIFNIILIYFLKWLYK